MHKSAIEVDGPTWIYMNVNEMLLCELSATFAHITPIFCFQPSFLSITIWADSLRFLSHTRSNLPEKTLNLNNPKQLGSCPLPNFLSTSKVELVLKKAGNNSQASHNRILQLLTKWQQCLVTNPYIWLHIIHRVSYLLWELFLHYKNTTEKMTVHPPLYIRLLFLYHNIRCISLVGR